MEVFSILFLHSVSWLIPPKSMAGIWPDFMYVQTIDIDLLHNALVIGAKWKPFMFSDTVISWKLKKAVWWWYFTSSPQLHQTIQENQPESVEELVPTDLEGPVVSPYPHAPCHPPWPEMWQHFHHWYNGLSEDWGFRPGNPEEQIICQKCYRYVGIVSS